MSRLSCGIVLNIDIFRTRLEERACSTYVELNRAEVNLREAFCGVHAKVLKTSIVVFIQKISELARRPKILNGISLGFLKKDVKLVIPFL